MTAADMKKFFIKSTVFSVISISLILHRAATKHIMITDAAGTSIDRGSSTEAYNLLVDRDVSKSQMGKLIIPLSKSVGSDDIVLEDRYMDHELLIYIDSREEGFYLDNAVKTDLDIIDSAVCISENASGAVCLDFKLDSLYANHSSLTESGTIEVEFFKPYEGYDKIVIIDPESDKEGKTLADMSFSAKDAALDVAMALKGVAEKDEAGNIKFYYTRGTGSGDNVTSEDVLRLIDETKADMLVGIGTRSGDKAHHDGILTTYNDSFYLRKLSNAALCNIIEKNCAAKAGGYALGMEAASEDDEVLMNSHIPSCRVLIGDIDSDVDKELLGDGSYKNKLSAGIYQGVVEAFEEMK